MKEFEIPALYSENLFFQHGRYSNGNIDLASLMIDDVHMTHKNKSTVSFCPSLPMHEPTTHTLTFTMHTWIPARRVPPGQLICKFKLS